MPNGFSKAYEAGNCCYRSSAGVASNVFIFAEDVLLSGIFRPPWEHIGRAKGNEVQIGIRHRPA
jgi:hypothetical protein